MRAPAEIACKMEERVFSGAVPEEPLCATMNRSLVLILERSVYDSGVFDEGMKSKNDIKKSDLHNSRNNCWNNLQYKPKNIVSPQVLSDS
jgi:hypothetical protein